MSSSLRSLQQLGQQHGRGRTPPGQGAGVAGHGWGGHGQLGALDGPRQEEPANSGLHSLQPSSSAQEPSNRGAPSQPQEVDMAQAYREGRGPGPNLRLLQERQKATGITEEYTLERAQVLFWYPPTREYEKRPDNNVLCTQVHAPHSGCGCVTCHFCRQKKPVVRQLTCRKCGPSAFAAWCGNCLSNRIGENIEEIGQDWVCPLCRTICNCSAPGCQRAMNGLVDTKSLIHEARNRGYRAVAHYLILAQLTKEARARLERGPFMVRVATGGLPQIQQQPVVIGGALVPAKQRKPPRKDPQQEMQERQQRLLQQELQRQVAAIQADIAAEQAAGGYSALGFASVDGPLGSLSLGGAAAAQSRQVDEAERMLEEDMNGSDGEEEDEEDGCGSRGVQNWRAGLTACRPSPAAHLASGLDAAGSSGIAQPPQTAAGPTAALPAALGAELGAELLLLPTPGAPGGSAAAEGAAAGSNSAEWLSTSAGMSFTSPAWLASVHPSGFAGLRQQHRRRPAPAPPPAPPPQPADPFRLALGAELSHAAASLRSAGDGSAAAPAAQRSAEGARKRQREELEGLLHRDTGADALHEGLPCAAGGAAPGQQHRRPPAPLAGSVAPRPTSGQHQQHQRVSLLSRATPGHTCQQPAAEAVGGGAASAAYGAGGPSPPQQGQQSQQGQGPGRGSPAEQSLYSRGRDAESAGGATPLEPGAPAAQGGGAPGSGGGTSCMAAGTSPTAVGASTAAGQPDVEVSAAVPPAASGLDLQTPAPAAAGVAPFTSAGPPDDALIWERLHAHVNAILYPFWSVEPDPLLGLDAQTLYSAQCSSCKQELLCVLQQAEAYLGHLEVPACIPESRPSAAVGLSEGAFVYLYSHTGLSSCLRLYIQLAKLLDPDDVEFTIVRRLLSHEPFVNFSRCDVRARRKLFNGWLELLQLLHGREQRCLAAEDPALQSQAVRWAEVAQQVATAYSIATTIAVDQVAEAVRVLHCIQEGQFDQLPSGLEIGAWQLNTNHFPHNVAAELEVQVQLSKGLLLEVLHAAWSPSHQGARAARFITPGLVGALLDANRSLGGAELRNASLDLLSEVVKLLGASNAPEGHPQLTVAQLQERQQLRAHVCDVLLPLGERGAVALLERLVGQDYPLWKRDVGRASGSAMGGSSPPSDGTLLGGGSAETRSLKKLTTLAKCYGLLLSYDQPAPRMDWAALEKAAAYPYSSLPKFWRSSNWSYRLLALTLVTGALELSPHILASRLARINVLTVWVTALMESKRHQAQFLTKLLAANPHTAGLFRGVPQEQVEMVAGDRDCSVRTELLAAVMCNLVAQRADDSQLLQTLLSELPPVLESRSKEISLPTALARWQVQTAGMVMAMLRTLPVAGGAAPAPLAKLTGALLHVIATWISKAPSLVKLPATAVDDTAAEAQVRMQLRCTVLEQAREVFDLLVSWGAPARLESDKDLLKVVATVVLSCLESRTGSWVPGPLDRVVLELLAKSLTVSQEQQQQGLPASGPHQLCRFVLSRLLGKHLLRANLKSASYRVGGIHALCLMERLLEVSGMRGQGPAAFVLQNTLHHFLELARPRSGEPSLMAKEALFRLLALLVRQLGNALPPCSPPAQEQVEQQVLRAFLRCMAADAVSCVVAAVSAAAQQVQLGGRLADTLSKVPTISLAGGPASLKGTAQDTDQCWVEGRRQLSQVLAPPLPLDVDSIYTLSGGADDVWKDASALAPPSGIEWRVAERALGFVHALCEAGQAGAAWALACFPALHLAVVGVPRCSEPLRSAYMALRTTLAAKWPKLEQQYVLRKPAPAAPPALQPRQAKPPAVQAATAAASAAPAGPTASTALAAASVMLSAARPAGAEFSSGCSSGSGGSRHRYDEFLEDQPISRLGSLPANSRLPVTAVLKSIKQPKERHGTSSTYFLELLDFSGQQGAPTSCTAVVLAGLLRDRMAVLHEQFKRSKLEGRALVLRLTRLVLFKAQSGSSGLKATEHTTMELNPGTPAAQQLAVAARRHQPHLSQAQPSSAAPPALPPDAASQLPATQRHGTQSVLTPRFHFSEPLTLTQGAETGPGDQQALGGPLGKRTGSSLDLHSKAVAGTQPGSVGAPSSVKRQRSDVGGPGGQPLAAAQCPPSARAATACGMSAASTDGDENARPIAASQEGASTQPAAGGHAAPDRVKALAREVLKLLRLQLHCSPEEGLQAIKSVKGWKGLPEQELAQRAANIVLDARAARGFGG